MCRVGRAQVDGPADSILPLVDRLSVALLRDVWRSREPLPSLDLGSLTTDSIAALRAYLQGERYYRRADEPLAYQIPAILEALRLGNETTLEPSRTTVSLRYRVGFHAYYANHEEGVYYVGHPVRDLPR